MARAIYNHEVTDPDYSWLISRFRENNPDYVLIDVSGSPLVLVKAPEVREVAQPEAEAEKVKASQS